MTFFCVLGKNLDVRMSALCTMSRTHQSLDETRLFAGFRTPVSCRVSAFPQPQALHVQRDGLTTVLPQSRRDKSTWCTGAVQLHGGYALGLICSVSAYVSQLLSR